MLSTFFKTKVCSYPRRIAVLGASGSIGTGALEVIAASQGRLQVSLLSVHRNCSQLVSMTHRFKPAVVVVTDETADRSFVSTLPPGTEVLFGEEALLEALKREDIDVVLSAIVGYAGLRSTIAALEADKTVALANKESLVVGGGIVGKIVASGRGRIVPVDSEHSAILQCLRSRMTGDEERDRQMLATSRLILTASGGPFRTWSKEALQRVTPSEALNHPTWRMGKKITIDSATMMNKALEIVEATWLFGMDAEQISVLIHPQSLIHSMVEMIDGTVMAQLSSPDMRLPIQGAFYEGELFEGPSRKLDWNAGISLELFPPDPVRFPALELGKEMATAKGTTGVVVNAANEVAVEAFLGQRLAFDKIVPLCQTIVRHHNFEADPNIEALIRLDAWARKETTQWIYSHS